MIPAAFEYARAESVDHAIELLSSNEDAKILAGGHSLLPLMRLRLARPVDARRHRPRLGDLSGIRAGRRRRGDRRADPAPRRGEQRGAAGALPDRGAHGRRDRRPAGPSHGHDRRLGRPRGSGVRHADGAGGARRASSWSGRRRRDAHRRGRRTSSKGCSPPDLAENEVLDGGPRAGDRSARLELHQVPPPGAGLGARRRGGGPAERRRARRADQHGRDADPRRGRRGGARTAGRIRRPRPRAPTRASSPPSDAFGSAEYRRELAKVLVRRALGDARGLTGSPRCDSDRLPHIGSREALAGRLGHPRSPRGDRSQPPAPRQAALSDIARRSSGGSTGASTTRSSTWRASGRSLRGRRGIRWPARSSRCSRRCRRSSSALSTRATPARRRPPILARLRDAPRTVLARFTNYFQTKEIPTSAELPCAGTGVVRFVPRPRSATSRAEAAWVTVSFVGQP